MTRAAGTDTVRAPARESRRAPTVSGCAAVELLEGDAAVALLARASVRQEWDALHAACPWATAFQSHGFVATWYHAYASRYVPVVAVGQREDGRLAGLLALAVDRETGELVPAGTHHAEYDGWISSAADADAFLDAALGALAARFRGRTLVLRYLPPAAPRKWTARWRCAVRPVRRAILDTADPARGAASLRKKSNKSRLNRLRRVGEVSFERVTELAEFRRLLDELMPHYHLRQGAVHGVMPFEMDRLKRGFHEALFELPGFLHVTALRAGSQFVAAHVGVCDGPAVSLGIFTHSAALARHSPGKLHVLHLAAMLADEGFENLDLTPGEGWKDRFASRHEDAYVVHVFFSAGHRMRHAVRLRTDAVLRAAVRRVGSSPDALRARVSRLRAAGPAGLVRAAVRRAPRPSAWLCERSETRLYRYPAASAVRLADATGDAGEPGVDWIDDLLAFAPSSPGESRKQFLTDAMAHLARGARLYTRVHEGVLLLVGWVSAGAKCVAAHPLAAEAGLGAGDALVEITYVHPQVRGGYTAMDLLRRMFRDSGGIDDVATVWLAARPDEWEPARTLRLEHAADVVEVRTLRGRQRFRETVRRRPSAQPPRVRAYLAVKRACLYAARTLGLFRLARRVTHADLRILCYHGFALDGESAFAPRLFMEPDTFGRHMDLLARWKYPVIGLEEGLRRLEDGTLPTGATVITIDDGPYSVLSRGLEHLVRHGFAATLYQTTYYSQKQTPVFRVAMQYLVWRTAHDSLDLDGLCPGLPSGIGGRLDLRDDAAREETLWKIIAHAEEELSDESRCELARETAVRLGVDWDAFARSRLVGLLDGDELRALLAAGVDLQLHTHRHRFPEDPAALEREIEDNRAFLEPIAGRPLEHLCYPSNEYAPELFGVLRELGVKSGTTCDPGLNRRGGDPMTLRRFLDGECVSPIELEAEQAGLLDLLRRVLRR